MKNKNVYLEYLESVVKTLRSKKSGDIDIELLQSNLEAIKGVNKKLELLNSNLVILSDRVYDLEQVNEDYSARIAYLFEIIR